MLYLSSSCHNPEPSRGLEEYAGELLFALFYAWFYAMHLGLGIFDLRLLGFFELI